MTINMLPLQADLQRESYGADPSTLEGHELAEYVRYNCFAFENEIHEYIAELRWKPWGHEQGTWKSRDKAFKECIDMLHFWMNLVNVCRPGTTWEEIESAYLAKHAQNKERMRTGYYGDGREKVEKDSTARESRLHQR